MPEVNLDELHASAVVRPVDLSKLRVDRNYQRIPSMKRVDEMDAEWNILASELLLVSDRGPRDEEVMMGGLILVNGQHRFIVAHERKGLKTLDARVVNLRKEPNPVPIEAALRLATGVSLPDKVFERFRAQLAAGNEESVEIVRILARNGTKFSLEPGGEGIMCVAAIEKVFRADLGPTLEETLRLIKEVWGDFEGKKASAAIVKGIAWFVYVHSAEVDRNRLVEKMRELTAAALEARARNFAGTQGGGLWQNVYFAILGLYNEGIKSDARKLKYINRHMTRFGTKGTSGANIFTSRGSPHPDEE